MPAPRPVPERVVEGDGTLARRLGVAAAVVLAVNLVVLAGWAVQEVVPAASEPTAGATSTAVEPARDAPTTPGSEPTGTAAAAAAPVRPAAADRELLVPPDGAHLGAFVGHDERGERARVEAAWAEREAVTGRPLGIAHWSHAFDEPFPTWRETWHHAAGRIPMVSWASAPAAEVAAGAHDRVLRERARAVAALGTPMFLRWGAAVDGVQRDDLLGTPADDVAAWRHVVDVFREEGAHNAVWVWCADADAFDDGRADARYPGDDVVDWTCAHGHNPAADTRWRGVDEVFGAFHDWGLARGRPMMVGQFGTSEGRLPGAKGAWFEQAEVMISSRLAGIRAWVHSDTATTHDWRPTTSPSAVEGWRRLAMTPWLGGPVG